VGLRSSSTFSSKPARGLGPGWRFFPLLVIACWATAGLAAIDVFINIVFAYPTDPTVLTPSRLQQYFEYGRSAEGALTRMTRPERSATAPITLAGWYEPLRSTGSQERPGSGSAGSEPEKPVVTIYGGSQSVRLANALGRVSKDLAWRSIGAPGATPNWSYGAFLRDRGGKGKSVAVVMTFDAAELAMITSFSPAIWSGDFPMPYTGDRFHLEGGQLKVIHPPYDSFEAYERTFFDPKAWPQAVDFFAKNDPIYDAFSFLANALDRSALARLLRRAYNSDRAKSIQHAVLDKSGFHPESEAIQVARAIIHEFATRARADGMIPVVYLVNNLGYSDILFRALKPALDADAVPYVNSHEFVSASDPNAFLPDGHFTDANDDRLAVALEDVIKKSR
jgi:hypothetical protein